METTIVGDVTSINHGNSLDFACKENRTLSESKDPDGDGLFNVVCYNGVLERQYLWPESNEVNTIFVHRYIRPKVHTKYLVYLKRRLYLLLVPNKRRCPNRLSARLAPSLAGTQHYIIE